MHKQGRSLQRPSEGTCHTQLWDFQPPDGEATNCCCFNYSGCGIFCHHSSNKLIESHNGKDRMAGFQGQVGHLEHSNPSGIWRHGITCTKHTAVLTFHQKTWALTTIPGPQTQTPLLLPHEVTDGLIHPDRGPGVGCTDHILRLSYQVRKHPRPSVHTIKYKETPLNEDTGMDIMGQTKSTK